MAPSKRRRPAETGTHDRELARADFAFISARAAYVVAALEAGLTTEQVSLRISVTAAQVDRIRAAVVRG